MWDSKYVLTTEAIFLKQTYPEHIQKIYCMLPIAYIPYYLILNMMHVNKATSVYKQQGWITAMFSKAAQNRGIHQPIPHIQTI